MLQQIQVKWRSWREKRREHQLQRALYKAEGHAGARDGGFEGKPTHGSPNSPPGA